MNAPFPPAETDLSSARDKRLVIAAAVIGFGAAMLAATFAGTCFLVPVPHWWQALAGVVLSVSVIYAGMCAMPEDAKDMEDDS
jgi:hypothetical protein